VISGARRQLWSVALAIACTAGVALQVQAHSLSPSLLELQEDQAASATVHVRFKQPKIRVLGSNLLPVLPDSCYADGDRSSAEEGTGIVLSWTVRCPAGLVGARIAVQGIEQSKSSVLLRISLADGRPIRQILTSADPGFVVPERESALGVFQSYVRLGVAHILTGFDHLAFVFGLFVLVGWGRRLYWTVTAFTIGHSVTLALATLGVVSLPSAPIEAGIALSIFVVAVELGRPPDAPPNLMQRLPWLMAGAFGLLHGLGFAGALTEAGLPQDSIPLALFSFNVGVELGQLAFLASVATLLAGLRAVVPRRLASLRFEEVAAYGIGSLAAYWCLERLSVVGFGPGL